MASSDEEGEIVPECVTNYHFIDSHNALVPFSVLPLHWSDHDNVIENGDATVAFLLGTTDGGLQKVYKEVIGWKLELSYAVPEVYSLSKGKIWIKLQKPRKGYEDIIKTVLIVVRCLHFAKRNIAATRNEILSHLMKTFSSNDVVESLEKCLSDHLPLIQSAVANDNDLAKSKYLETFLMEIENPGRREILHEENQATYKPDFIVYDDDVKNDDDFDDEPEGLFDSVCAFCDNGGDVLPCEGQCIRSFHPTVDAGVDTSCESLGFENAAQYEAISTFLCDNCKYQKHQCFVCEKLGSSDKSSAAEVFPCVSATCGHFYHPKCVANLLHPSDETLAKQLISQIAAGESFTCPIHKCRSCQQGENKDIHELQFAVCRRCPKAYHRKCLPKAIAFKGSADGTIKQRAWDNLLPKRILMYCMKHKIIPNIETPKRDHLLFPSVLRKRNQEGTRIDVMSERRSRAFGNLNEFDTGKMPKVVGIPCNMVTCGSTVMEKDKSSTMHKKRYSEDNIPISRNSEQPSNMVKSKSPYKATQREHLTSRPVKTTAVSTPPRVDADMKRRILKLKDSTSSFDLEEFIKEKKRRCTREIYTPQNGLDKTITMGKVEASVKAVKAALKKLEDGCSVEDAKAVCEPNVLHQLIIWKKKLKIFLAPFLYGARYTSFGRHFTKVDKLKEIVDRLHRYVEDGDMDITGAAEATSPTSGRKREAQKGEGLSEIVDFCCGSNDFSCLMKEKLDSTGKRCSFKNYDLITPKNTFSFEKRDWFSVPLHALPEGSRLVMGLNPPFGVHASLANKFIDHALKFRPKLLILIVPEETRRLNHKSTPYDLIWEEQNMLSGKSFYLPGCTDSRDQPLDDWNNNPPPLSLWSRPDWTAKHIAVAEKHGHVEQKQNKPHQGAERVVSNYLMEENHDCFGDFSNIMTNYQDISAILDDLPEEPNCFVTQQLENANMTSDTLDNVVDMDISSPVYEPTTLNPPCIQSSHSGHHPGFSPPQPQYANTNASYGPYAPGGFVYTQSGHNTFPSHPGGTSCYGQGDFATTSAHPPYANYGHPNYGYPTYPPNSSINPHGPTFYGQPEFTREANVWPPGTPPPDFRYN